MSFYLIRITMLLSIIGLVGCGLTDKDLIISQDNSLNESCFSNRSVNSRKHVNVEFKNNFSGTVEVVWQDYEGDQIPYGSLAPGAVKKMTTYVSHPWSFIFAKTGNCVGYYNPRIGDNGKRIEVVRY